jgi:hypothetical protein
MIDEYVRRHHRAVGRLRELGEYPWLLGGVDHLESVSGALEEAPGAPTAQRALAGVEHYLPLVHVD